MGLGVPPHEGTQHKKKSKMVEGGQNSLEMNRRRETA